MNVLEARRRLLGADVYKKTAEGNPISVRSLARMYPGIEMEGWTEQASTTGAQLLDVEFMKQVSSWIGTGDYRHLSVDLKPNTTYTMFVRQNNMHKGYNPEYDGDFAFYLGEVENSASPNFLFGNTTLPNINVKQYTFTTTDKPYYINLYIEPWSEEKLAIAFDELLVDIMLVEGGSVVPYEPYTGNQPSPSPDYPQEIINAGKYNEETQKWEYEVNLNNNGYFQKGSYYLDIRPVKLTIGQKYYFYYGESNVSLNAGILKENSGVDNASYLWDKISGLPDFEGGEVSQPCS